MALRRPRWKTVAVVAGLALTVYVVSVALAYFYPPVPSGGVVEIEKVATPNENEIPMNITWDDVLLFPRPVQSALREAASNGYAAAVLTDDELDAYHETMKRLSEREQASTSHVRLDGSIYWFTGGGRP